MTITQSLKQVDNIDVKQLPLGTEKILPEETEDCIVSLGNEAVEPLIEIIEQQTHGYAPMHATAILGRLRPNRALNPLIRALEDVDVLDPLNEALISTLSEYGSALVEPALDAIARSRDKEYQRSLSYALAKCGAHDDRVFEHLLQILHESPDLGASLLVDYDDPRALEHLYKAFDDFIVDENISLMSNQPIIELKYAINELGGTLSPTQKEKYHRSLKPNRRFRSMFGDLAAKFADSPPQRKKTGRNEPCWCGSGKKYKKCHLRSDMEGTGDL